jgi:hypothetical protein
MQRLPSVLLQEVARCLNFDSILRLGRSYKLAYSSLNNAHAFKHVIAPFPLKMNIPEHSLVRYHPNIELVQPRWPQHLVSLTFDSLKHVTIFKVAMSYCVKLMRVHSCLEVKRLCISGVFSSSVHGALQSPVLAGRFNHIHTLEADSIVGDQGENMQYLCEFIANLPALTNLTIRHTNLRPDFFKRIGTVHNISSLELTHCTCYSRDDPLCWSDILSAPSITSVSINTFANLHWTNLFSALDSALSQSRHIKTLKLNLAETMFGPSDVGCFSQLTNGAQHGLTSLSTSNNYASIEADIIQILLKSGPALTCLKLSNDFSDGAIDKIAEAVAIHPSLSFIDLSEGFQVTRKGMNALLKAAYTNSNVQTVWRGPDFDEIVQLSHAIQERQKRNTYKKQLAHQDAAISCIRRHINAA